MKDIKQIPITSDLLRKEGFIENEEVSDDDNMLILWKGRQSFIISHGYDGQENDWHIVYSEDIGMPYHMLRMVNYMEQIQKLIEALTDEI